MSEIIQCADSSTHFSQLELYLRRTVSAKAQVLGSPLVATRSSYAINPCSSPVGAFQCLHYRHGDTPLQRKIRELLTRPVGGPRYKPLVRFKSFLYQAASWTITRRVVAKVKFHCAELFSRVGFIVTNLGTSSRAVVRVYNKRGTAEQWIKEGKQAVALTRLSCHRFRANEVRLWLSLIAYNLGNLWRRLALANADRKMVSDQLAAAAGENRRTIDPARASLLSSASGESSDPAALCEYAAKDRGVTVAGGIRRSAEWSNFRS